ncbi:MAG: V4R domain-containing protein [Candidatus Aenigmatarchaeota archaeon]
MSKLFLKGKYGILSSSKKKDSIKIRIEECALCSGCENIHQKICGFFSGFIRGWLEETTKFSWDVVETKCIANGDDHCEFECKKYKLQS